MANWLGVHLQLLIGSSVPIPAPAPLAVSEALESVQVTLKDKDRSGFQLIFQVGRSLADKRDYALLKQARLRPFQRVIISTLFGIRPLPVMDGIITNHQLVPGSDPGTSRLTVMGEDLSLMIDLEQEAEAFPQLAETEVVLFLINRELGRYGVVADVASTEGATVLTTDVRTMTQDKKTTHLGFIKKLADRFGYVFYLETGAAPGINKAYWGPPSRGGTAQGALSVNMGPNTNVETITFSYNELTPKRVRYEAAANTEEVISTFTRTPPLAARIPEARKLEFMDLPDGLTDRAARRIRAQGKVNESFDGVVTATGTLDALRYGRILKPRMLLDVRGAGEHFNGSYYVNEVTHKIDVRKGEYKQDFKLSREGVGARAMTVRT